MGLADHEALTCAAASPKKSRLARGRIHARRVAEFQNVLAPALAHINVYGGRGASGRTLAHTQPPSRTDALAAISTGTYACTSEHECARTRQGTVYSLVFDMRKTS